MLVSTVRQVAIDVVEEGKGQDEMISLDFYG